MRLVEIGGQVGKIAAEAPPEEPRGLEQRGRQHAQVLEGGKLVEELARVDAARDVLQIAPRAPRRSTLPRPRFAGRPRCGASARPRRRPGIPSNRARLLEEISARSTWPQPAEATE